MILSYNQQNLKINILTLYNNYDMMTIFFFVKLLLFLCENKLMAISIFFSCDVIFT